MRTNRLFLALAFAFVLGGSNVFAQSPDNDKQPRKQRQRPTPEQMTEFQAKRMENRLMLDDATAAKFIPLYKEYLQALKDCRKPDEAQAGKRNFERTDEEIEQAIQDRFDRQQKALDTKKKYFDSFKKILNARQLEKVFAPAAGNFGPKKWDGRKNNRRWDAPRHCPGHHGCGTPEACPFFRE